MSTRQNPEIYNLWKEQKQNVSISPDFTDRTMQKVVQYDPARAKSLFDPHLLMERLSRHALARAALLAAAGLIAFIRILFTVRFALG